MPDSNAQYYRGGKTVTSIVLPAVHAVLEQQGLKHRELECDPALADTAAFCAHYGFDPGDSANAIIVASRTDPVQYCCCIVLANTRLDVNKTVCKLLGVRKASFASAEQTKDLTGMEIGGVTPFGLPANIPIYVDAAVMGRAEVIMGGGNRSSKLALAAQELEKLPNVQIIDGLAKTKE